MDSRVKEIIALSQVDIPLVEEPFKDTVEKLNMDYDEFLCTQHNPIRTGIAQADSSGDMKHEEGQVSKH